MSYSSGAAASGGAIYGLGIFGAWVYFWQQADGFWEHVLAVLEGLVWPAIMVYDAFSALRRPIHQRRQAGPTRQPSVRPSLSMAARPALETRCPATQPGSTG